MAVTFSQRICIWLSSIGGRNGLVACVCGIAVTSLM